MSAAAGTSTRALRRSTHAACDAGWRVLGALALATAIVAAAAFAPSMSLRHASAADLLGSETYQIYWGDIHSHSAFSNDAASLGTTIGPAGALDYARNVARLNFCAVTDHAEWLNQAEWRALQQATNCTREA